MEVAGQTLDDAQVVALLEQLKVAIDSPEGERALRRFMRGGPFGEEWVTFFEMAILLFRPMGEEGV